MKYRIKNGRKSRYFYWEHADEIKIVEQEFALMLTGSWEKIYSQPSMHASAVKTAKKLRELKTLLVTTHQLPQSVN